MPVFTLVEAEAIFTALVVSIEQPELQRCDGVVPLLPVHEAPVLLRTSEPAASVAPPVM